MASSRTDGTQHESHDEKGFGKQPRKMPVTKDLTENVKGFWVIPLQERQW